MKFSVISQKEIFTTIARIATTIVQCLRMISTYWEGHIKMEWVENINNKLWKLEFKDVIFFQEGLSAIYISLLRNSLRIIILRAVPFLRLNDGCSIKQIQEHTLENQ